MEEGGAYGTVNAEKARWLREKWDGCMESGQEGARGRVGNIKMS